MARPTTDLDSRDIWRVSYGAGDRQYLDVFRRHDVALVGCWGVDKEWPSPAYDQLGSGSRASIRTLAERIKVGQVVLATRGRQEIGAVGVAMRDAKGNGPYRFNPGWIETEGWDLFHQIRVKWLDASRFPKPKHLFRGSTSPRRSLIQVSGDGPWGLLPRRFVEGRSRD